jgi:hypothetical protein
MAAEPWLKVPVSALRCPFVDELLYRFDES